MQDEWKVSPDVTLNLGVRYDLQFLETINTDADNVSPRVGVAWSPFDSRRTIVRGSAGLFYDRVPLRALANALLSAGNTTDLNSLRQIAVSLSPTQAGAPTFPNILSEVVPSVTLPSLTTMDREPPERVFAAGERRGRAADRRAHDPQRRVSVPARVESDHDGESERSGLRSPSARTTAAARIRITRTTASTPRLASPTITACTSRSCSGRPGGVSTGSPTRCRSR